MDKEDGPNRNIKKVHEELQFKKRRKMKKKIQVFTAILEGKNVKTKASKDKREMFI
jgi:hypothetical protein